MPVTARLVQRLHETLGDEATNDLLAWWEETATVNRAAIREVTDLYYERFEARLEKGLAELRSEVDEGLAELRSELDKGLAESRAQLDQGLGAGRVELVRGLAEVRTEMASQRADLIKWMFMFWVGTVVPLAGLTIALNRF